MLKRMCFVLCIVLMIPMTAFADTVDVSAQSAVVIDTQSSCVLYEKNAHSEMPMASTTKIMTCLLACESDRLNEDVTITDEMLTNLEGTMIYVKADDTITLYDLVKGAMLASGNDAATAIAVYLGGSVDAFVELMNRRAGQLGMNDTLFVTPSGLDDGNHHSTAYDMALLAKAAVENEYLSSICKLSSDSIAVNGEKRTIYNHNKLLNSDASFVGVKTGFTEKAGRCLVSAYNYEGNIIISVTLNAPNDWDDHKRLVDYAKTQYNTIASTDSFYIPVVGDAYDTTVECVADYSVICIGNVEKKAYYYPFLYMPIECGDIVGKLEIYCNGNLKMTVDIIVKE